MPWYGPVSTALATLGLVALLTAAILLATPAANAFFRAPGSAGPPMPGTGYPTGGQYPGHPQGPATQGYPPAQGRPGLNGIVESAYGQLACWTATASVVGLNSRPGSQP